MPPNPAGVPIRRTSRRFSIAHVPVAVYLGIDIEIRDNSISYYSISVHDGMYCTDYYEGELVRHDSEKLDKKEIIREAFTKLHEVVEIYALAQNFKVQLIACSRDIAGEYLEDTDIVDIEELSTMSEYWRDLDALPFRVETHAATSDERASAAVRKAVMW